MTTRDEQETKRLGMAEAGFEVNFFAGSYIGDEGRGGAGDEEGPKLKKRHRTTGCNGSGL